MENYLLNGHNFKYTTKNHGGSLVFRCEDCLGYFVKHTDIHGFFYIINGRVFKHQSVMPTCNEIIIKEIIQ